MPNRSDTAVDIARSAGALAVSYFERLGTLVIEDKGPQDFVSEADKAVELYVRDAIAAAFPDDGIVGEEHAPKTSATGYTWIIDPIDGTTNFISGIPAWTVVISIIHNDETVVGVTCDPLHNDMYFAIKGKGAWLNDEPLHCRADTSLARGSVGTGYSNRVPTIGVQRLIDEVIKAESMFHRNASGALSIAYVAAGRLLGYIEEHMNAWDCLAGQLLVAEAGGRVEVQSANDMVAHGGRVVVGSAGVFDELVQIADRAYGT